MLKSAARDACLPSLPTIPMPEHQLAAHVWRYEAPVEDATTQAESSRRAFAGFQHTDVCCLDHGHIIPTVTYTTHRFLGMASDEQRNVRLLRWRTSTSDDGWQLSSEEDKLCPKPVEAKLYPSAPPPAGILWKIEGVMAYLQRLAVDDETRVQLGAQKVQHVPHLVGRLYCLH